MLNIFGKQEDLSISRDVKLARYYQEVIKYGTHTVRFADIDYLELGHILTKAIKYYKLDIRTDLDISGDVVIFQKTKQTIKSDDRLERYMIMNLDLIVDSEYPSVELDINNFTSKEISEYKEIIAKHKYNLKLITTDSSVIIKKI